MNVIGGAWHRLVSPYHAHTHHTNRIHDEQVGEGAAAGEGLRRECALLQRIDSQGVERCLGVGSVDGGLRTVEVLAPYLVDDRQLDRYGGLGLCVCAEVYGGLD